VVEGCDLLTSEPLKNDVIGDSVSGNGYENYNSRIHARDCFLDLVTWFFLWGRRGKNFKEKGVITSKPGSSLVPAPAPQCKETPNRRPEFGSQLNSVRISSELERSDPE
jgi:hypothetical protein